MDGVAEPGARQGLVDLRGALDVANRLGERLGGAVESVEGAESLEQVVADRGTG
jgi:hypothetical protein